MRDQNELRLPALEISQGPSRRLYSFGIDGKTLPRIATVSRLKRKKSAGLAGYQRPEVLSHISDIRRYIESENPMIPNAIVIAFDERVRFEAGTNGKNGHPDYARSGELVIPLKNKQSEAERPGWVVDGQQRLAAIRDADVSSFPICAVGFIAGDLAEQREQFILVNSTKPLPKGLIYELLPETDALLPPLLRRRRFPARLLERMNHDEDSPLKGLIRTATMNDGIIRDNSVLRMLENSLNDGVLYRYRDPQAEGGNENAMLAVLKEFWSAVAEVFPKAWGLPPRRSRLTHGAGIVSMGFLMDAIADRYRADGGPTMHEFAEELRPLAPMCRWTEGYWAFGPGAERKWDELQNTTRDIQILSNYLLVQYRRLRRAEAAIQQQQ